MLKSNLFRVIACVTASLFCFQVSDASIVDLTFDSSMSSADLSINNSGFETSSVSGTGSIDVASLTAPFGTAQITALDISLDDALSFSFAAGLVTVNTQPGDDTISLVTPGAAGVVTNGLFDQLGNQLQLGGTIAVSDPLNLLGGSQTLDLSSQAPTVTDFLDFEISRTGDIKTVSGTFSVTDSIEVAPGTFIPLAANGSFLASGVVTAVPEPGSLAVLGLLSGLFVIRRQRS